MPYPEFRHSQDLKDYIDRTNRSQQNGRYDFENCKIQFSVDFKQIVGEFEEAPIFHNTTFGNQCSFQGMTFKEDIDFSSCRFNGSANFKNTTFEKSFSIGNINHNTLFNGAHFKGETSFGRLFEYVNLSNCQFYKEVDLGNAEFRSVLNLHDTIFKQKVNFENANFKRKVNAWNVEFREGVSFEWANFREKLNFTEGKVQQKCCNFYGSNFEENAYFYKTFFNEIDLKNTVIEKGVYFLDAKIKNSKRETNRIIKNEFLRHNNRIEALNFHQKEMLAYLKELVKKAFYNTRKFRIWSLSKNIGNLIILMFNYISNGFGLWWPLGIIFLFVTTFSIYNWYISTLNVSLDNNYWGYYLEFLNPTHKYKFIEIDNITLNQKSYVIDFIGRIASSLGIYQTIQAFRKYGKI